MVKARSRILGRFLTGTGILFLFGFQNLPAFGQLAAPELTTPELTTIEPADRMQQGKAFYQAGQLTQAIAVWQQAADRYQAAGDALHHALTLSYLALASQQLGQWSEAKEKTQRAIATLDEIAPNATQQTSSQQISSDRQLIRAQVLNTQASLQFAQGQVQTALATWTEAGAIYGQVGTASQKVGNLINQAQAQQSLGLLLRAQQTLAQVEQHLQSLPDSPLKAMGWRSLGNGRMITGQSREAEQALQKSLAIAERLSLPAEQSATLVSLANVARLQEPRSVGKGSPGKESAGKGSAAIALYQRAARLNVSPLLQLQAQLNHLSLLIQTDRISEAQALAARMQPQLEQLPASRATVQARINFAESVRQLPDRSSPVAAAMLATAVQQARSLGDRPSESQALGYLGRLYEQRQQWSGAKTLTEQALVLAQVVNSPEIAYQWQWQLGRILKATGEMPAATQSYWAAFKTLQSVRGDLGATNPELQFSFREQVEPVYRELVDLLLQPTATDAKTGAQTESQADAQMNLKQAREVIESLRLAELDNFFRTACLEGQTVAIDAVQQTDAAVIYPIILANRLEVIVSLPGQPLRHYATAIPQHQVETTLEQWRRELEKPLTSAESKRLGQQVYNWLLRPVAAELQARSLKTLVFVLDGSLRSVPMAALYDGQQYLIERHSVALTPGLRLLKPQPLQNQGLSTLFAGLTQERHGFRALSYVEQELQEVQAEVSSRILLNQQFTSAQLQTQLQPRPFPIVHLATHGQFSSNADETFVLAWDKPIRVKELSLLLRDREDLQTHAIELLVLSACETAEGDKRAALGLAGVAVQAGARSTLASLWSLDDESGAQFVGPFYRELAKGNVSKAEALRQAQLALLRDPDFRHPRYWAPYVLLGNWL